MLRVWGSNFISKFVEMERKLKSRRMIFQKRKKKLKKKKNNKSVDDDICGVNSEVTDSTKISIFISLWKSKEMKLSRLTKEREKKGGRRRRSGNKGGIIRWWREGVYNLALVVYISKEWKKEQNEEVGVGKDATRRRRRRRRRRGVCVCARLCCCTSHQSMSHLITFIVATLTANLYSFPPPLYALCFAFFFFCRQ